MAKKMKKAEIVDVAKEANTASLETIEQLMARKKNRLLTEREKEVAEGWRLTAKQKKDLAKIHAELMLADILPLALEKELMLLESEDSSPELRHKVAESLLNRSLGKPTQQIEQNVGGNIKITLSPELEQYSK